MVALIQHSFFPLLAAGAVLGAASRIVPAGPARVVLQGIAAVVFFVPQIAVFVVGNFAVALVLHRGVLMALWLVAGGAITVWQARQTLASSAAKRGLVRGPVLLGAAGAFVALAGLWLGSVVVRDIALPRGVVQGLVTKMWVTTWSGGPYWHVAVNGAPLNVTRDVYTRLRPGMEVRVQVGAGSATVLAVLGR